jgi:hypothetical protein
MSKLLEGLPPYMRRNAEVHMWWVILAVFVAMIVSACGDGETRGTTPKAPAVRTDASTVWVIEGKDGPIECVSIIRYDSTAVACNWGPK